MDQPRYIERLLGLDFKHSFDKITAFRKEAEFLLSAILLSFTLDDM